MPAKVAIRLRKRAIKKVIHAINCLRWRTADRKGTLWIWFWRASIMFLPLFFRSSHFFDRSIFSWCSLRKLVIALLNSSNCIPARGIAPLAPVKKSLLLRTRCASTWALTRGVPLRRAGSLLSHSRRRSWIWGMLSIASCKVDPASSEARSRL